MKFGYNIKIGPIYPGNKRKWNKYYGKNGQEFHDIIKLATDGGMIDIQLIR